MLMIEESKDIRAKLRERHTWNFYNLLGSQRAFQRHKPSMPVVSNKGNNLA